MVADARASGLNARLCSPAERDFVRYHNESRSEAIRRSLTKVALMEAGGDAEAKWDDVGIFAADIPVPAKPSICGQQRRSRPTFWSH
jgi:hypothetical protein